MAGNMAKNMAVGLCKVSFAYGDRQVLRDFTLSLIAGGEEAPVVALAGSSGCGKTTVLRLLAGLNHADSGEVCAPVPRSVAFLFQEDRLLDGLTAVEQVGAVLPDVEGARQYLAMVELAEECETLPDELSGGMRRRLALARALAYGRDKSLLLLDEPFAGVDPECAARIMQQIRSMHKPVIYTAHDSQALDLADRTVLFKENM